MPNISKSSLKQVLIFGVGLSAITCAGISVSEQAYVIVIICMMIAGWAIGYMISHQRRVQSKRYERLATKNSKIESELHDVSRRLKQLNPIIRNTAGSIGRTAPVVRKNSQMLMTLLPARTESTGSGSPESVDGSGAKLPWTPKQNSDEDNPLNLPAVPIRQRIRNRKNIKALMIADEFTLKAFEHEWEQIEPTPQNWHRILSETKIDLLFVESAWEGNAGSWRYHFTGNSAPRQAVIDLVEECKNRNIPTLFWNKEDPPHYHDFIDTARLFDFIFTTDENMLERYQADAPDSTVEVLPFAAQPAIHNPSRIQGVLRTESIVFGGMYFRHKYPERREQMNYLLPAASEYGLDIYSRQLGGNETYQFPEYLKKDIVGSLEYAKMLTAYHKYKVVINVNSVVDSPSMCARRIFEATASGAAVVTSNSAAVGNFYPNGLITEVGDLAEASVAFKTLLRSPEYRDRKVHLAQRHTWENHTYANRVEALVETIGIDIPKVDDSVSVISPTNRPHMIGNILDNYSRQNYSNKELLILTHGFSVNAEIINELSRSYDMSHVTLIESASADTLGKNLNTLIQRSAGRIVARMDDDDWYGSNYLRDMVNSQMVSGADLVGKAASYIYFESLNQTILTYAAKEKVFSDFVRGASTVAYRDLLSTYPFREANQSEDSDLLSRLVSDRVPVYASDRYNFSVFRSSDASAHTWRQDDSILYSSGELKYIGRAYNQISI